ncbi:hypothetical protein NF699_14580 [Sphingomonadaceae bacterium OTU29LAMAA1]|nr:hypothetical protein NF699_14580 [Sphingomonadaceae bacterium OTU29LAMAA1]
MENSDLEGRIARLERRCRAAFIVAVVGASSAILAIGGAAGSRAIAEVSAPLVPRTSDVLTVRELNIVDGNGVTRVKIGAPLAHAIVNGQQNRTRGGRPEDTMSGVLLFDAEGVERSGYATVDHGYSNVLLTLDEKNKQHAMFIAEPTGATTLRLFNADTKDRVDIAIDKDGPSISMIHRGKTIFRVPET